MNQFIDIPFSEKTLDRYFIRTSIFKSIQDCLPYFKGDLLDAGCGKMPYREYINENSDIQSYTGLDIDAALVYDQDVKPDLFWDGTTMPIADQTYHTVIATEVLEHCPEPLTYLKEVSRVLKKDGYFFFTVPFVWPLHEVPHDAYRYTPFTLERLFKEAGFSNVTIKSLGGFNASLATMLGLWLNRYIKKSFKRSLLLLFFKPFIKWLIKHDTAPTKFKESTMCTGFYGVIQK